MPDFTLPFALPLRPEFSSLYERALVKAFCFRMCYKSMLFIRFSPNLLCTGHTCSFMYSNLTIFSKDLPESNLMSEKNYELWVGWGLGWEQRKPSLPLFPNLQGLCYYFLDGGM